MAISFPDDKTGILNPGTGPLETGDLYRASNGVLYIYNAVDISWTGPTELESLPPEVGVPFPLPPGQGFILRDTVGSAVEEFLTTQNSSSDDSSDDGFYIVGNFV
jgi:hypothetical protein